MRLVRLRVEVHAVRRLVGACVRRRLDVVDVAVLEIRELKRVHDVGVAEGAGGGRDPKVALKRCGRERGVGARGVSGWVKLVT